MSNMISKELAKELIDLKGMVRGIALKNHEEFILKEKGSQGLERLEKAMADLGYPVNHKDIQSWDFYPVGLEIIELLAIKDIFGFSNEKFEEIGIFGSMASLLMKVFIKHFTSIKAVAKQAPTIWKKYYTIGNLKIIDLDEEKRQLIIIVENFKLHPFHCLHLKGYFSSTVKMVVGGKVSCQEIKCPFRGDKHHEFLIKW